MVLVYHLPHLYPVINVKDEKYLRDFGKNFRKLRLAKEMSQEALGNEAGIGKNQIGLIERGEINVTICTIKKIAKSLGYEPKDFLDF